MERKKIATEAATHCEAKAREEPNKYEHHDANIVATFAHREKEVAIMKRAAEEEATTSTKSTTIDTKTTVEYTHAMPV